MFMFRTVKNTRRRSLLSLPSYFICFIFCFILCTDCFAEIQANEPVIPDYLDEKWPEIVDILTKVNEAQSQQNQQGQQSTSGLFGYAKNSVRNDINQLMDRALDILIQGRAVDIRHETDALQERISPLEVEADRLRNRRIEAFGEERKKIAERLEEIAKEIQEIESNLASLKLELIDSLSAMNLKMEPKQLETLMNSVTGDDILQYLVVASNMRSIIGQLAIFASDEWNDLDMNRRYIGMYLAVTCSHRLCFA